MHPRAKATIDTLQEVVYEISIGTKLNDLDLCLVSSRFAETRFAEKIVLHILITFLVRTFCYCNSEQSQHFYCVDAELGYLFYSIRAKTFARF